jgi:hypothetical protein
MHRWNRPFGDEGAGDVAVRVGGIDEFVDRILYDFVDELVDRCDGEWDRHDRPVERPVRERGAAPSVLRPRDLDLDGEQGP